MVFGKESLEHYWTYNTLWGETLTEWMQKSYCVEDGMDKFGDNAHTSAKSIATGLFCGI